jgi:hypothetical protein
MGDTGESRRMVKLTVRKVGEAVPFDDATER